MFCICSFGVSENLSRGFLVWKVILAGDVPEDNLIFLGWFDSVLLTVGDQFAVVIIILIWQV